MRFWWLIPLVLVAVAAATGVGWWFARRAGQRSGKKGWVANSGYLRGLPKYQALVRRTRSRRRCPRRPPWTATSSTTSPRAVTS